VMGRHPTRGIEGSSGDGEWHGPKVAEFSGGLGLHLLLDWQQVCATEPKRTIFNVWCSDPKMGRAFSLRPAILHRSTAEEIRDGFAGRQGQTGASDRGLEGKDIEHDSQRFALGSCPFVPRSFKRTISLFPFDFRNACKRIVSLDILP
jgi:hypothetical protein